MLKLAIYYGFRSGVYFFCALVCLASWRETFAGDGRFVQMSFEDLLQVKISSVSRREESVSDAAASIYVITNEAIRNSGAATIPEALRLDPRLQVSRITATQYAIGIRGFTTGVNNKLLVMIDGRTIYTSLFSGVFWDHQDVMLEDIERIEVISGPGATLWGTNAVNGVINIITKRTSATHGWLAAAHSGNSERGARVRYGTELGEDAHLRVYGKVFSVDANRYLSGQDANDGAARAQVGFRTDWKSADDRFTFQGDVYKGGGDDRGSVYAFWKNADIALGDIEPSGNNLLARWERKHEDGSDIHVQAYWDYFKRRDSFLFQPTSRTFDIELQQATPFDQHRIMWGLGYRRTEDKVDDGLLTYFIPAEKTLEWGNLFSMADLHITDALTTTIGLRLEHNEYTGMEYLPSLRATWKYSPDDLIWASLSRAVRAPSRYDRDIFLGVSREGPWVLAGGPNFDSEVANVLEIGYRGQSWDRFSYSITAYYHDWDKLRSGSAVVPPLEMTNGIEGKVYGADFWANAKILPYWQLSAGGTFLHKDLNMKPGVADPEGVTNVVLSNDANYYGQIRSTIDTTANSVLQLSLRYIAELKNQDVPSYTLVDLSYSWQFHPDISVAVTAQNLADRNHYEFGDRGTAVFFSRSAWLTLTWEP
ncbi:MAG: TonB-dependent receptor [Cellvibrionaceae bacterium]|nr:TonB-dependent receptor [Cellvibrionaceae bacterium]